MSSIPLPALDLKPPTPQPGPLEQYENLERIQAMQNQIAQQKALAPLQQQQAQNAVQSSGLQVQQQQQQQASTRALMASFANLDPSDPNYFDKGIKAAQSTGQVLPQQIQGLMNARLDYQTKTAGLTGAQQKAAQNRADSLYSLGTQALKEPDQNLMQDWPVVRQKIIDIHQGDQNFDPNSVPQQFPGRDWLQGNTVLQGMSAAGMRAAAQQQQAENTQQKGLTHVYTDPTTKQEFYGQIVPGKGIINQETGQIVPGAVVSANPTGSQSLFSAWKAEHPNGTVEQFTAQQNALRPEFPRIMPVNDAKGNLVGYNTFSGTGGGVRTEFVPVSSIHGLPQNLGGTPGVIPPKPTAAVLTQSQRSDMIQPQVQALNSQIDDTAKYLGPLAGRWSDVMVGKVGANAPQVAKLHEQLKLFSTALMLAHGLKGEQYANALEKDFRLAQSPEDLKARIAGADGYLLDYANSTGHGPTSGGNVPSGGGLTVTTPNGKTYSFKDQASADKFKAAAGIQ